MEQSLLFVILLATICYVESASLPCPPEAELFGMTCEEYNFASDAACAEILCDFRLRHHRNNTEATQDEIDAIRTDPDCREVRTQQDMVAVSGQWLGELLDCMGEYEDEMGWKRGDYWRVKLKDEEEVKAVVASANLDELLVDQEKRKKRSIILANTVWYTDPWAASTDGLVRVPFVFKSDVSSGIQGVWREAIALYEALTCIRYEETTDTSTHHVLVQSSSTGCWSYVGNVQAYVSPQLLNLRNSGCQRTGIASHESMHALGVFHHQSRYDRDDYVTVIYENVQSGKEHNFNLESAGTSSTYGVPYDVGSIMHYQSVDFANAGTQSIISKDPKNQNAMGNRDMPTFYDFKLINAAYCSGICTNTLNCERGGYQNPNDCNTCVCPAGFSGTLCDEVDSSGTAGCGDAELVIDDEEQCITSNNYPSNFNTEDKCSWLIKRSAAAAAANREIEATFNFDDGFELSYNDFGEPDNPSFYRCNSQVELRYKDGLERRGNVYCTEDSDTVTSVGGEMLALFAAGGLSSKGFKLCFKLTPGPETTPPPTTTTTTAEFVCNVQDCHPLATCTTSGCECRQEMIGDGLNDCRLPPECQSNDDCNENGFCNDDGFCECNANFYGDGEEFCQDDCACRVRGDPIVEFMNGQYCILAATSGEAKYLLYSYAANDADNECRFMVETVIVHPTVQGEQLEGAIIPRHILITFGGEVLQFDQDQTLIVGDDRPALPYSGNGFTVTLQDNSLVFNTESCGIQASFDGIGMESTATIHVPPAIGAQNVGMCGRCGQGINNFRLQNGSLVDGQDDKCDKIASSYTVVDESQEAPDEAAELPEEPNQQELPEEPQQNPPEPQGLPPQPQGLPPQPQGLPPQPQGLPPQPQGLPPQPQGLPPQPQGLPPQPQGLPEVA